MQIAGVNYRSIWLNDDGWSVDVIDQTRLPHEFAIRNLRTLDDACEAIRSMVVRGAPLIGATAAYGYCLALREDASGRALQRAHQRLLETRPTAVNLRWALERVHARIIDLEEADRFAAAMREAREIADLDVETNRQIGVHGLSLIRDIAARRPAGEAVNILTHCNAGWLATVDWGTATAPIYLAHDAGIDLHIWVDETRPRNQGGLTAWELGHHGVPHTYIADNAGGHLMQRGLVDLCLVGSDRTTRRGDVCNKIGTYLKALAARHNQIPFYACLPGSTIDWRSRDGIAEIPIEMRDADELSRVQGRLVNGEIGSVEITPGGTAAANYAFDVTPANLVTGLITERGIVDAAESPLQELFGDVASR